MVWVAAGVVGGLAISFAVALALGRRLRAMQPAVVVVARDGRRVVGLCGSCGGPVMLEVGGQRAVCPCGDCSIPAKFIRQGAS